MSTGPKASEIKDISEAFLLGLRKERSSKCKPVRKELNSHPCGFALHLQWQIEAELLSLVPADPSGGRRKSVPVCSGKDSRKGISVTLFVCCVQRIHRLVWKTAKDCAGEGVFATLLTYSRNIAEVFYEQAANREAVNPASQRGT